MAVGEFDHSFEMNIRKATRHDSSAIERVMKESMAGLGAPFYDADQVRSAVDWIARLDLQLIDDETYFVIEEDEQIVACGGWSRRGKLFTGGDKANDQTRLVDPASEPARIRAMFVAPKSARRGLGRAILERCEKEAAAAGFRDLELMATLPGEPLYAACGYVVAERVTIELPDGAKLESARMEKKVL